MIPLLAVAGLLLAPSGSGAALAKTVEQAQGPAGDARRGEALFVGAAPFARGGAACASCHSAGPVGGGALARDLTGIHDRLGPAGLTGALKGLPFPVMREIYAGKSLDDQEVADLSAFFLETARQKPVDQGPMFLGLGAAGALVLFAGMGVFWPRRRQGVREKLLGGKK